MRFSNGWTFAAVAVGLTALVSCFADSGSKDDPARGLTVHEWGTFSTFSGSNGKDVKFYPNDDDLPDFVHGYLSRQSKAGPAGGTVSLETPVLYFYADRPLTASVHVEFPKGTLTEWYPQAKRTDGRALAGDDPPSTLDWDGIKVLPGEALKLPTETKEGRYYAARETDAAPLRVAAITNEGKVEEQEKFLFYRGVGDLDMPLKVRAWGDGKFTVDWTGGKPAGVMLLVQVRAGQVRFEPFIPDHATDGLLRADVRLPDAGATLDQLGDAMTKILTEQGLYEKEARAMVKTWRSAWFGEQGTRVLYVLPREATDSFLPTKIDPKPTSYVRVMVGRHDVLTPDRERQIDGWVATLDQPAADQDAKLKTAAEEMARLGRYRDAAWEASRTRLQGGGK
ncbi:MAG TPA: hypothetical protein VMS17_09875 [Gemmataceae bacterium]|nr:hypothetical protein [Gemmataceae bacterium]